MINTPPPNTDIQDIGPVGYVPTYILATGTYVKYRGTMYMVGQTTTHQSVPGQFTTYASLHPVDDDGDMTDRPAIEVNLDIADPQVI